LAEHEFTLILDGRAELDSTAMNALFEAGCDDATVSSQGGRVLLDFDRSAPSMREAVVSAIADVRKAGMRVARVDGANDGQTASESSAHLFAVVNSALQITSVTELDPTLRPLVAELLN
jgi:hypothetical protein